MSKISLIIMSAGESSRFKEKVGVKKHWLRKDSKPLWLYVADSLSSKYDFNEVIITASKVEAAYMRRFCDYNIVVGGSSRQESLKNALKYVKSEFVAVSDAARCELDFSILDSLFNVSLSEFDCVIPTLNAVDTIFLQEGCKKHYLNRENVRLVQTPQISRVSTLLESFKLGDFSDESSAINALGGRIYCVSGSNKMDKLTYVDDLYKYSIDKFSDTRVGYGFDVHKFSKEGQIYLGGIKIDCGFGFEAHSDGDVLIHSLCDALLGAVGAGDIGEWFPPSDDRFKNIDSKILLREVCNFITNIGYRVANVDIMIMAEIPKILPYKEAMIDILSEILNIKKHAINIKATTMEKMGFIGRGEGVCVSSSVLLYGYEIIV